MEQWNRVERPAEIAEQRLLDAILSGHFAAHTYLPGERDLAAQIGVTRPTLREALQRLARDGWLDIQHGKPTRVRDFWQEGNMGVLSVLAQRAGGQSADFVAHLLEIRVLLAPTYTRQALEVAPSEISALLANCLQIDDNPESFARADWDLQHLFTLRAANPIFRLLLNSFQRLYQRMGEHYFESVESRERSRAYYAALLKCANDRKFVEAEILTREVMEESLALWKKSS